MLGSAAARAAVDEQRGAGDVARRDGAEEDRRGGELLDGAQATGRDALAGSALGGFAPAGGAVDAVGRDRSRVDVVERHAGAGVPTREHLEGGDEARSMSVGE